MQTIQVIIRSVYGADKIYPANEAAETLARIAGTKTLTREAITGARALGLTVEVVDLRATQAAALGI